MCQAVRHGFSLPQRTGLCEQDIQLYQMATSERNTLCLTLEGQHCSKPSRTLDEVDTNLERMVLPKRGLSGGLRLVIRSNDTMHKDMGLLVQLGSGKSNGSHSSHENNLTSHASALQLLSESMRTFSALNKHFLLHQSHPFSFHFALLLQSSHAFLSLLPLT